jgi:spermidine synthase
MLGLGCGAAIGGRWADRAVSPLRLYAILEAGIGVCGLLVPVLIARLPRLYLPFSGDGESAATALPILRFAFGFGVLLVPTVLMGATFPVLVREMRSAAAARLGQLYAANTIGAVAGTFAAGYVLVPWLGVAGTGATAAGVNFAVALIALALSRRTSSRSVGLPVHQAPRPVERHTARPAHVASVPRAVPLLLLALSGVTTLGTQILWTRILVFPLFSTTYAFTTILGGYLTGLAIGGAIAARWLAMSAKPWTVLAWLQGLLGLSLLIPVGGIETVNSVFTAIQTWGIEERPLSIAVHIGMVVALLLPQTLLAGAAYPLLLRAAASDMEPIGTGVGRGLLFNLLGGAIGAGAAAQWAIPALGILPTFAALGAVWIGCAVMLGLMRGGYSWRGGLLGGFTAAAAAAAVAWGPLAAPRLNPFEDLTQSYGPTSQVLAYGEGVDSTLAVVGFGDGLRALRINGFEAAGVRRDLYGYMQLMAHLPMLIHQNPKEALIISFGTGTTAGAAARHRLDRLDLVDLDRGVFAVADYFSAVNRHVLRDPRVRAIVNDGRNFLVSTDRLYDVITLEPMPPTFAGMVNLYSREFYSIARSHLRPGGVLCQWVPFHLTSTGEADAILRTFVDVFPQSILLVHRGSGFLIGSTDDKLTIDATRLAAGLADPGVREDLAAVGAGDLISLLNLVVWGPETLRVATADATVVTDDRPTLEFPEVPFRVGPQSTVAATRVWRAQERVYLRRQADRTQIVNLSPADAGALTELRQDYDRATVGGAALELGNFELAAAMFEARRAACRTDQCRAQVAYWMGRLAERRRDLPAALRYLREADRLDPGHAAVRDALRRVAAAAEF